MTLRRPPPAGVPDPGTAREWERLAQRAGSPFRTPEWQAAWWAGYGRGAPVRPVVLRDGRPVAGLVLQTLPLGGLAAAANEHAGDWGPVAADGAALDAVWGAVAALAPRRLHAGPLRADDPSVRAARRALVPLGYRFHRSPGDRSPYLALPESYDLLLAGLSRNLRSQAGRRRRALERQGRLVFRCVRDGPEVGPALEAVLRVEASGWKGRGGTAILGDARAERLYRRFAHDAAAAGWLRLFLLELDGELIAGDVGLSYAGTGWLLKTAFDESFARLSPGLVLRGEVLRACIEEGLAGYDFLGPDDTYKLRWTGTVRPRVWLHAYRGTDALAGLTWRRVLRPALTRARDRLAPPGRP